MDGERLVVVRSGGRHRVPVYRAFALRDDWERLGTELRRREYAE